MIEEISAEELFDIWHTQGNCVEIEWHAVENGEWEAADRARRLRHELNRMLFGENPEKPELKCQYKHTLSVRHEMMELTEKWHRREDEELVKLGERMIDRLGEELIRLIQKIREESLEITE